MSYESLPRFTQDYLSERGSNYGITGPDLYEEIPWTIQDNPLAIYKYLKARDVSHIIPLSHGGSPNDPSNYILELSSVNRSRQDRVMSDDEIMDAQSYNEIDAFSLDYFNPDIHIDDQMLECTRDYMVGAIDLNPSLGHDWLVSPALTLLASSAMTVGANEIIRGFNGFDLKRMCEDPSYAKLTTLKIIDRVKSKGFSALGKAGVLTTLVAWFPCVASLLTADTILGLGSAVCSIIQANIKGIIGNIAGWLKIGIDSLARALKVFTNPIRAAAEFIYNTIESTCKAIYEHVIVPAATAIYKHVVVPVATAVSNVIKSAADAVKAACSWFSGFFGWKPRPA